VEFVKKVSGLTLSGVLHATHGFMRIIAVLRGDCKDVSDYDYRCKKGVYMGSQNCYRRFCMVWARDWSALKTSVVWVILLKQVAS